MYYINFQTIFQGSFEYSIRYFLHVIFRLIFDVEKFPVNRRARPYRIRHENKVLKFNFQPSNVGDVDVELNRRRH